MRDTAHYDIKSSSGIADWHDVFSRQLVDNMHSQIFHSYALICALSADKSKFTQDVAWHDPYCYSRLDSLQDFKTAHLLGVCPQAQVSIFSLKSILELKYLAGCAWLIKMYQAVQANKLYGTLCDTNKLVDAYWFQELADEWFSACYNSKPYEIHKNDLSM